MKGCEGWVRVSGRKSLQCGGVRRHGPPGRVVAVSLAQVMGSQASRTHFSCVAGSPGKDLRFLVKPSNLSHG